MKFSDFKTSEAEVKSNVVAISLSEAPKQFAGRTIIRDWKADPWDTEALDAKMCPACGADVAHRYGTSANVAYYDCKERADHRFARIFNQPTGTSATLAAASAHQTTLLQAARTIAERSKNG